MPLVRIDLVEGRTDEQITALADAVQEAMIEYFNAPTLDRYQVITEHRRGLLKVLDTGLGYPRTDQLVVLQITQQGRTAEQKVRLYAGLVGKLAAIGVPPTDVVVSIVENTRADWSFGVGIPQFLVGAL